MKIKRRVIPTWQAAAYYAISFIIVDLVATFAERPIFLLFTQPILRALPFSRLFLGLATTWLCAFVVIQLLQQFYRIDSSRGFKMWAVAMYLFLNILLLYTNLSLFGSLLSVLARTDSTVLAIAAIFIALVAGAYFWWITDLVLKNQPDWAVRWVESIWLRCDTLLNIGYSLDKLSGRASHDTTDR